MKKSFHKDIALCGISRDATSIYDYTAKLTSDRKELSGSDTREKARRACVPPDNRENDRDVTSRFQTANAQTKIACSL